MAKTKNKEKSNKKVRNKVFRVLRIIKNVLLSVIIVFLSIVLIVSVISRITGNPPSLFGFSLYRVSSGSMRPELEVKDIILVRSCDGEDVEKGDIISYVPETGEMKGNIVTHRVEKAPYKVGDEYWLVTKGDANEISDAPIRADQVKGKLIAELPFLKLMFDFFATPWGLLALIALIILAFFNEILVFVKSVFGIGTEPEHKESVDDLIKRYQSEGQEKQLKDAADAAENGAEESAGEVAEESSKDAAEEPLEEIEAEKAESEVLPEESGETDEKEQEETQSEE